MPLDNLNEIKRLHGEIDLLKSEINQKMQTMEQKQLELERKLSELENGTDFAANGNANAAVIATAESETKPSKNPPERIESDNSDVQPHAASVEKLDGIARKGKMSSLLEKYSD